MNILEYICEGFDQTMLMHRLTLVFAIYVWYQDPFLWLKLRGIDMVSEELFFQMVLPQFWKGVYSKKKEFAPWANSFILE